MGAPRNLFAGLEALDRRVIYLLVAIAVALPLISGLSLLPARMKTAEALFDVTEQLEQDGKIVLLALDWGPGTQAENLPQSTAIIEHLMRRRIPFALISTYQLAAPFLQDLPLEVAARLEKEHPEEHWAYGKDWVNLGFRPNGFIAIQSIAASKNIPETLKSDALGTPLSSVPCFREVRTLEDIGLLVQITGLVGTFNSWVQFFFTEKFRPPFVHGCTSITIPEAYDYLVAGQIVGLLEGAAGAAWYEELLSRKFPQRIRGPAREMNSTLAVAHLLIITLIAVGNIGIIHTWWSRQ